MTDKIIKQYLAAYYDGTATEQEEQALENFFSDSSNVPDHWKEEQKTFRLLQESAKIPLPTGLEERLETRLNTHIEKSKRFTLKPISYKIAGIAAAILLCVTISINQGLFTGNSGMTADTYKDPHEAAVVAQQALVFLSQNLNKGIDQVNEAEKDLQEVNEILNNQLK